MPRPAWFILSASRMNALKKAARSVFSSVDLCDEEIYHDSVQVPGKSCRVTREVRTGAMTACYNAALFADYAIGPLN